MCWPFRGGDSDSDSPGRMCDARVSGAGRPQAAPWAVGITSCTAAVGLRGHACSNSDRGTTFCTGN